MNGKNSYGGYVGAKMFYITLPLSEASPPVIWTEGESTENQKNSEEPTIKQAILRARDSKMTMADFICKPNSLVVLTKISNYSHEFLQLNFKPSNNRDLQIIANIY